MALYELPMNECSSCGNIVGQLYPDFYDLTKQLMEELKTKSIPTGSYITKEGEDLSKFVKTYYTWYNTHKDDTVKPLEYFPTNIIARALLKTRDLTEEHLPFGSSREADNQLSFHEPRICCLRMLETDPMMTDI
jgi:DNA-directed RNA polymerase subunit N (RpoN/RPB10)